MYERECACIGGLIGRKQCEKHHTNILRQSTARIGQDEEYEKKRKGQKKNLSILLCNI